MAFDTTFVPQIKKSPEVDAFDFSSRGKMNFHKHILIQQEARKQRDAARTLGKNANIVAKSLPRDRNHRFRLLATAQKLLHEDGTKSKRSGNVHRTRLCHACRSGHVDAISLNISKNPADKKASFSGVQTCGTIWSCPVCAPRIAVQRGNEISFTIDKMIATGHVPILLTPTTSHKLGMRLATLIKKLKAAWRKFTQDGSQRRLKAKLGIVHAIKAMEVTRTYKNGWHPHAHILLFAHANTFENMSHEDVEKWRSELGDVWIRCLKDNGLKGTKERALDVKVSKNINKEYLSKLGLEQTQSGNLNYELSGIGNKNYKGRNIWQILESAMDGNKEDEELYIEYVKAMAGTNWITFSRGLKKFVGLDEVEDDQAAEDESNDNVAYEKLLEISDDEYVPVRAYRAYAELLDVAAKSRNADTVKKWLADLLEQYDKTDRAASRQRLLDQYEALDKKLTAFRLSYNRAKVQGEIPAWYFSDSAKWKSLRKTLHIK